MVAHGPRRRVAVLALLGSLLLGSLAVPPVHAVGLSWTVDSTGDAGDQNTANILCRTIVGTCTLRAAIQQANAIDPGPGNHHTIILPAGTITMFLLGVGEDNALTGDFDVKRNMTIRGAGSGDTIIQGSTTTAEDAPDRIFDLQALGMEFVLQDLTVRRGHAVNAAGGAIRVNSAGADITIDNVVLSQNRAFDNAGAAIAARSGPLTIVDSRITNNDAPDAAVINVDGGTLTVRRSTFANNTVWNAVIALTDEGEGLIERSTFNGNDALPLSSTMAVRVGRDSTDASRMVIRNSTFAGNAGPDAAVIVGDRAATLQIESTTIAGNTGFGLSGASGTTIRNTLLAGNSRGNCGEPSSSLGNNLETGSSCSLDGPGDISGGTADLDPLADNGGPTRTRALGPNSEAIDAGLSCPGIDQRGASRPKDGDANGHAKCDIGAFEAAKGTAATPSPTVLPTIAPTAVPTAAPSAAPTEPAAATASPTAEPVATGASPGPTPAATAGVEPVATTAPGATSGPDPAANPLGGDAMLWIVVAIVAIVIAFGLLFALRRRRQPES